MTQENAHSIKVIVEKMAPRSKHKKTNEISKVIETKPDQEDQNNLVETERQNQSKYRYSRDYSNSTEL